jgi:hypothetical protein
VGGCPSPLARHRGAGMVNRCRGRLAVGVTVGGSRPITQRLVVAGSKLPSSPAKRRLMENRRPLCRGGDFDDGALLILESPAAESYPLIRRFHHPPRSVLSTRSGKDCRK